MGEDGCVVRRNNKGVPLEEDDIVGFLPFPFHFTPFQSASSTPFTLPTSPFPLPLHPLLALRLLLDAHIVSVECSMDRHGGRHSGESGGGGEVDVVIFVHDRFLQRTRLRSHLLRQAMLSLFRSFPPPPAADDYEEEDERWNEDEMKEGREEEVKEAELEEKNTDINGMGTDNAESSHGVTDNATAALHDSQQQPVTNIFTVLQQLRHDTSSLSQTIATPSLSASEPASPALSFLSPTSSIATTASLSPPSLSSPGGVVAVVVGAAREKRRIVPIVVHVEEEEQDAAAVGWGKEEKLEEIEDATEEEQVDEGEEDEEDDEEGEENDEDQSEVEDEEGDEEEEDDDDEFGLDELNPAEHVHSFIPLHLMSAPPPPPPADQLQPAEPVVPQTEEELKEEKEQEEEGVRIEESYVLDPAVLADENDPSIAASAGSSAASSPSSASSTQPSSTTDNTASRTSLHTLAWQKRDLDSLYDSIRPPPNSPPHPNPPLLATTLLPFQQQALHWMIQRETDPTTLPHPLYEPILLSGLRCWYHRVNGEVEAVAVEEVRDVRGGILAEMMGLGKTIEMIALVLERPYKPAVSIAQLLPLVDGAGEERRVEEVGMKIEEVTKREEKSVDPFVAPVLPRMSTTETFSSPRSPPFLPTPATSSATSSPLHSPPPSRIFRSPSFSTPLSPTIKPRTVRSPTLINDVSGKPEVKGTLIITPMSIVYQWQAEINKHAPSSKVLIYKPDMQINLFPSSPSQSTASAALGLSPATTAPATSSATSPMSPTVGSPSLSAAPGSSAPVSSATLALSEYDIVLCNYSILASQVNYSQQPHYNLRFAKQYAVPLSPLLEVHWHRLVLDEAQRVQSPTANSARMCQRVNASYRWAVTGTPIGLNGLNDMYGLISFLGVGEYSSAAVWQNVMRIEEEEGMARLRDLLRRVMWRHSKAMVKDQIALPPLYTHTHYLRFNEVEHEAYRRMEFEIRGRLAFQAVHGMLGERDDYVKRIDALRQMCDHPQVLAGGLFNARSMGGSKGWSGWRAAVRYDGDDWAAHHAACQGRSQRARERGVPHTQLDGLPAAEVRQGRRGGELPERELEYLRPRTGRGRSRRYGEEEAGRR